MCFCSEDAQFGLSEINWGILPGGGASKVAVTGVCLIDPGNNWFGQAGYATKLEKRGKVVAGLVAKAVRTCARSASSRKSIGSGRSWRRPTGRPCGA